MAVWRKMKRIESCPSIVDSVSFFDNDTYIADSFHADLAPLPASPGDAGLQLHPGALRAICLPAGAWHPSRFHSLTPLPRRTVPEHTEIDVAAAPASSPRKDKKEASGKALSAEDRKQRRCGIFVPSRVSC